MVAIAAGNVVTFSYIGSRAHTPKPKVFIIHPNWMGLCHAIKLNKLSRISVDLIKKYIKNNRDASPIDLYSNVVLTNNDIRMAYRKYIPKNMKGVVILRKTL